MIRALLITALLLIGGQLAAHPHAWIDLRVSVLFSDDGGVEALRQEWAFDPTYSHLLLEDMAADQPDLDLEAALQVMAERMLGNLGAHRYFTEITMGDRLVEPLAARAGALTLRQRRLHLQFELPVAGTRPVPARTLTYRVYDPTYWIEILHDPGDVVHLAGGEGCNAQIHPPQPEAWMVAYAATLNRNQRAPIEDLGRPFAEVVSIECNLR
jgi:ABC-type uncharacterized transport system substrate-binding protein